ncbi:hypothetical protein PTKIN_Ptkin16aG0059500 [Pterospermum kingtungense]
MSTDVFGKPITQEVLLEIREYATKARQDRAEVARQWKDSKYEEATNYVRKLKEQWGTGVSTLCLVYNATGEPLTFVKSHDWWGNIYQKYPQVIENGQWGGFLHVKHALGNSSSKAAVVYRGKRKDGKDADWLVAWFNPYYRHSYDNQVYAVIREAHHFDNIDWGTIENDISMAGREYHAEWEGCIADVKTESDTCPIYEAVLTLN